MFLLLKLWPQLVIQFLHFVDGFALFSNFDFQFGQLFLNTSMDCSCSAFLAGAAFKLSRNASHLVLHLPNTFLLPHWSCCNDYLVPVEARRGLFEVKSYFSSNSLTASSGFAVSLQFAEHATEYWRLPEVLASIISKSETDKIPQGTLPGKSRKQFSTRIWRFNITTRKRNFDLVWGVDKEHCHLRTFKWVLPKIANSANRFVHVWV